MAKSFCCQSVVLYTMSYQCPLYITMLQQEDHFQGGVVQAVVHWLLPGCGAQWVTSLKVMMILMTGGRYWRHVCLHTNQSLTIAVTHWPWPIACKNSWPFPEYFFVHCVHKIKIMLKTKHLWKYFTISPSTYTFLILNSDNFRKKVALQIYWGGSVWGRTREKHTCLKFMNQRTATGDTFDVAMTTLTCVHHSYSPSLDRRKEGRQYKAQSELLAPPI